MSHWSYSSILVRTFIWTIFVAYATSTNVIAQTTPPSQTTDDDPDSIRQGGLMSLSLVRHQPTIQAMELARDSIQRKDYLAAIPLLERILAEPNTFVPLNSTTEVGTHEEARRLMDQLPADLKQRLNEPRRASARAMWEQARHKNQSDVAAFLHQFGDLPQSVDAWWWIACRERDHARPHLAASAFARVANHPGANGKQKLMAAIAEFESAVQAGMSDRSRELFERLTRYPASTEIVIEGQPTALGQWIGSFRNRVPAAIELTETDDATSRSLVPPPSWQTAFPHTVRKEFDAAELKWRERQREQGVRPFSLLRPAIAGDLAIVRSLDAIRACDVNSGDIRWTIPNLEYQQIDRNWAENHLFQANAIEWVLRRTSADSIFGRVSTDAERIFVVQEPDRLGEFKINRGSPDSQESVGPRFNKLCCYRLESGSLEWEIGGKNADDPFGDQIFLSVPVIVDDLIYVMAQHDLQIRLFAIDANLGALRWSMELGTVTLSIADDRLRSRVACPIVWQDGLLLCSTSSGVVVAIDPLLQSARWGYRYPATTIAIGELQRWPNLDDVNNGFEPWWDRWREPFVAACHARAKSANPSVKDASNAETPILIFASPETEQLHAIRVSDGELQWRIPREGGLLVAGVDNQTVVVIEGDSVRGHDVATGEPLWRTQVSEIGGPGYLDESILVVPAASGGLIFVEVRSGRLLSDSTLAAPVMQSVAKTQSAWIAFDRRTLARYPMLSDVRRDVERELQTNPENEPLKIQAARLDLQSGQSLAAIKRLDGLNSLEAREARRLAIIDALKSSDANLDRLELTNQLKELSSGTDQLLAAAVAIARSDIAMGHLARAVEAALDGLTLDLDLYETLIKDAEVNVRPDRLLLGLIEQVWHKASTEQRVEINDLFMKRIQEARKSRDRFAVQQLAREWQGLDFSRALVVNEEDRVARRRPFAAIELRLLDAAGSDDKQIAMEALNILVRRFDNSNSSYDAAAIRRRIAQEQTPSDSKVKPDIAEDQSKNRPRPSPAITMKPVWPAGEPVEAAAEKHQSPVRGIYSLIPAHAQPGSLAERLDIYVDRNGNEVLFRADSRLSGRHNPTNEGSLRLPPSPSPFRGSVGYMLREAWGIGRIVILLVGGDLFAIAPLDEKGELNPSFLWSNPVNVQGSPRDTRVVMGKSGVNEGRHLVIDQLNRPIGRIGPVRANYLCFQRGSKLIAVETESGRTVWERLNLSTDTTVIGDDHFVYLWHENRLREKLSAIDGHKIDERQMTVAPSMMWHHRDSTVWTVSRGEQFTIEADDFRSGQRLWIRSEPADSFAAVLDPETLGLSTPDGRFYILNARTGKEICDPLTLQVTSLTGLATWHDDERWYIAFLQVPRDGNPWKSQRPSDSYRRILVNGTLIAVDREQPQLLWQRELIDEPIPLDQPQAAPILVQAWKTPSTDDSRISECTFRVLDKRTGAVAMERRGTHVFPNFLLNSRPENGILEVDLPSETVQLLYGSREKE